MEYEKTIHLEEPGTLGNFISYSERQNLTSLKVTGLLGEKDLRGVLRDMCDSEGDYVDIEGDSDDEEDSEWVINFERSPRLRYLDLSGCRYVDGKVFPNCWTDIILSYFAFPQGIEATSEEYHSSFDGAPLLETVILPDGVKSVGGFAGCEKLTNIVLPESVEEIGNDAFLCCPALTKLHIPSNVSRIGESAFSLSEIDLDIAPDNHHIAVVDGVLFSKGLKTLVTFPQSKLRHYEVPQGTEIIADGAFENSEIESIHIPDTVTTIGRWAFQNAKLRDIYIPDSVTEIGELCFRWCNEMEKIRFPHNIQSLPDQVVSGCEKLKELDIPPSVKTIKDSVIVCCKNLERVRLHDGLETITGGGPWLSKRGLLKEINLPKTLRHFPGGMFHYCPDLKTFNLDPSNPYFTEIEGSIYTHDKKTLIAVQDCETKTFTAIDGVEEIGKQVFYGFVDLEQVQLPDTLKRIGSRAFQWCNALKEIVLPAALEEMDFDAFMACESLQHVICLAQQPPQLNGRNPHWKFLHDSKDVVVEVPAESLSLYRNTDGWKDVSLQAIAI